MENTLGMRLKKLRENSPFKSQKEAANFFELTNYQLSRYESGHSKPDPDLITKFADHYGVTTDYLLGRTDHPDGLLNQAFRKGAHNLTDDEKEHLESVMEEELKRYRALRERFLKEKESKK
ncbi:transcriptional regulator [Alkalihalobacillus alcalophilus ATCC 27647 = CGMCC 1.3604]|uniref:Transcriptional regulator n=1 Tax=Alkalihalobacillus alcalophilus ATCC 27647 = CGMCC 1.3604 TaxID=1218173 RepID=A0A4V6S0R4_ALKAL|nr:helix-turn-helix transcriptional regulator [Alkalihalobacillus alcalophilus]MED1563192.1 helix-turn-helix transcriptional regulator [Alkalihalobacillus alcalophilus]THG91052.1 transcriptional regulator [Alkalihalobacillus alcalophilus ATCC 27647 = CGMCC 1.3604]